jgi:uncharacterized protein involved in exopolysaccharide biosynthesis
LRQDPYERQWFITIVTELVEVPASQKNGLQRMSVNTLETPHVPDSWGRDDEIDIRQYLDVVIRWWREILLITLGIAGLAALGILSMRFLLPPSYVASADVAFVRTVSNVSFDERFRTVADELGTDTGSSNARRSALLGLVTTGGIASEVIKEVGDLLTAEERVPATLAEQVSAEMVASTAIGGPSDLIRISVAADSPEKAATIANAWARVYVRQINAVYGQVPDEVLSSIDTALADSKQAYLNSQTALETFIATSRSDELNSLLAVLQQRVNQEVALAQAYLNEWQLTNQQLQATRALRTQIENGGEAVGRSTIAALQLLKIQVYGKLTEGIAIELRDFPEVTQPQILADVEGLILSLEQRLQDLENAVQVNNTQLRQAETPAEGANGTATTLTSTFAELQQVKAQVETENARKLELEQQRNIDWETYKTLSNKVAELKLARAAASSEVRLAAPAIPASQPVKGLSLVIGTGLAAFAGLCVGLLVAFLGTYLKYTPFLKRQRASASTPRMA